MCFDSLITIDHSSEHKVCLFLALDSNQSKWFSIENIGFVYLLLL